MKKDSDLPCFYGFDVETFKSRFMVNQTDEEVISFEIFDFASAWILSKNL